MMVTSRKNPFAALLACSQVAFACFVWISPVVAYSADLLDATSAALLCADYHTDQTGFLIGHSVGGNSVGLLPTTAAGVVGARQSLWLRVALVLPGL